MTRKPGTAGARGAVRPKGSDGEAEGALSGMELAELRERRLLAERFREARNAAGLTQKEVHERSGVDIASISRIEAADWNPSVRTLARLAFAMGVTIGSLFSECPAIGDPTAGGSEEPPDPGDPGEDPTSEG